ncbi:hypothetical protein LMG27952_04761 [Paraburkholderia hiiakae]|uniref:Uncharacterized protein n=1 Tax=Paraburkholderia hiiakae TaxID=1081782 RepID=A0ABM8NY02_9BURK|nr:DUF6173 family protein [Paraburkholderia hiiakae]CAD6548639.1 hypothetical protein LMG27952_04761 [Paraburkholderia hiiakae]
MSNFDPLNLRVNLPTIPTIEPPHVYAFKTFVEEVRAFETSLVEGEAVGAMLASFGKSVMLQITQISRAGQFFCFDGITENGDSARLVQHYTQASILLIKLQTNEASRPIGFVHHS